MKTQYTPQPLDTANVVLPSELTAMTELFAKNTHDVWAKQRIAEGWKYGKKRNDEQKEHPCLVPYEELPESEKEYDRRTATEAIRFIVKCGYEINRSEQPEPSFYMTEHDKYILWTSNRQLPDKESFNRLQKKKLKRLPKNHTKFG